MADDGLYYDQIKDAADYIRSRLGARKPRTAVVLGSGLGGVADVLAEKVVLDVKDVPHWPLSTAPGHEGKIIAGRLGGRELLLLKGRVHYYEGYDMRSVTFPTRVLGMLGIAQYIGTNASGGIGEDMCSGDIVLLEDHINFMGVNPLRGPIDRRLNVCFPDMTHIYSERLRILVERAAAVVDVKVKKGVYIAFAGPSYETPAEIRMARTMGASVVGMSTVPEVIVANAIGVETAVISCVANQAAGIGGAKLTEEEVLSSMKLVSSKVGLLLTELMRQLDDAGI